MDRYLYCMMEVGTREFLARCLTACIAAERGFTVLLGQVALSVCIVQSPLGSCLTWKWMYRTCQHIVAAAIGAVPVAPGKFLSYGGKECPMPFRKIS